MKRAWLLTSILGLAAIGTVAWWLVSRGDEFRLPAQLTVEEAVDPLDPSSAVDEASGAAARTGYVAAGPQSRVNGGVREALIAPPPSRVRFRRRLPHGAVLSFGIGVQRSPTRDPQATGVRFTVDVDGQRVFSRTLDPTTHRRDRRWFDDRIELPAAAERDVEIVLGTAPAVAGRPPAGTPGWSHLHVVRVTRRERQPASRERPNVLVLLVDTLRADQLGCYGANPSPSPMLDGVTQDGLLFEHAVAQASWTMPSVASILTGVHPRTHGVTADPADGDPSAPAYLPDALRTLAEHAQDAGITTVGVSANTLVSRGTNFAQGFETFVEFGLEPRGRGGKDWARAGDVNAVFLRWLRQNRDHRFLGYLHYMEPHHPYTPPERLRPTRPEAVRPAVAAGRLDRLGQRASAGPLRLPPAEVAYLLRLYDAEIQSWDEELGALLRGLADLGVRDSTIVVVTADHGEEFQEHGRLQHGWHLYDESIRVPLAIFGPGITPARIAAQAQGIDLFPTIAALLGLTPPAGLPGQNLLAAREGRPAFSEIRNGALLDDTSADLLSLRTPAWKLIWAPATGRYELYDLTHDPGEREDRFGTAPEGADLAALLARWAAAAPPAPPSHGRDPELRAKLRALGYLE